MISKLRLAQKVDKEEKDTFIDMFHRYLLLVLKPYLYIINNTVQEFIRILELIAFGS